MTASAAVELRSGTARVHVLPDEGGVAVDLDLAGVRLLARTPWAAQVGPSPAPALDEDTWVGRWRGGWQACLPTAGEPDPDDPRQSFHGVASQQPWQVLERSDDALTLAWTDGLLTARRRWELRPDGLGVSGALRLTAGPARPVVVAEHLVLGDDLLDPRHWPADGLGLAVGRGARLAPLDYAGRPTGEPVPWPGGDAWDRVGAGTPARVAALVHPTPPAVRVTGADVGAVEVRWRGLPHALLWQEIGASPGPPWHGSVRALGIEPTTTPHGLGTAGGAGVPRLRPGAELRWWVDLRRHPTPDEEESP